MSPPDIFVLLVHHHLELVQVASITHFGSKVTVMIAPKDTSALMRPPITLNVMKDFIVPMVPPFPNRAPKVPTRTTLWVTRLKIVKCVHQGSTVQRMLCHDPLEVALVDGTAVGVLGKRNR